MLVRNVRSALSATAPLVLAVGLLAALPQSAAAVGVEEHQAAALKAPRQVTLQVTSADRLQAGRRATFSGTTQKAWKGKRVVLQRRVVGGTWTSVDASTVRANGRFVLSARARSIGLNRWRAYVVTSTRANGSERRAYSQRRATRSLQWFSLYDAAAWNPSNFTRYEALIGGRTYSKSWGPRPLRGSGRVQFTLNGRCDVLRATVGVDDDSARGSRASFTTAADGRATAHGTLARGRSKAVQVRVADASTLTLSTSRVAGDEHQWGMWGNARVLCSAPL